MAGLAGANSGEFDSRRPHPVIDLMDEQREVVDMGGTMRLGAYPARLLPGLAGGRRPTARSSSTSATATATRSTPATATGSRRPGLACSGTSPDDRLVEFIELPGHPFWVGTQAHPEFKSRPDRPHPLFRELVAAALDRAEGRARASSRLPAFRKLAEREVYRGSLISVAVGRFAAPDGEEFERDVVHHPGAVSVVPIVDEGKGVMLVRQYRAAVDRDLLEIPAGKRDVAGEPPEVTARRELEEEIGMRAGRLEQLAEFYNSPGFCDEHSFVFMALDLEAVRHRCRASRSST